MSKLGLKIVVMKSEHFVLFGTSSINGDGFIVDCSAPRDLFLYFKLFVWLQYHRGFLFKKYIGLSERFVSNLNCIMHTIKQVKLNLLF